MCSGMVHPEMVLHALARGADGVMIIGCHLGECHYIRGNEIALARAEVIADTLEDLGYERGAVRNGLGEFRRAGATGRGLPPDAQ